MGIVLDLILAVIIILIVAVSAKRGVITAAAGLLAFAAAVIVSSCSAKPVAEFAYQTFLSKPVQEGIQEKIPSDVTLNFAQKAQVVMDNIPNFAKDYAEKAGLDISALSLQISKAGIKNNAELANNLEKEIVKPVTVLVLKNVLFFVLTVLLAIIFKLIAKAISEGIKELPVVGTADAVIGAVLGFFEGAAVVFVICCLLSCLKPQIKQPDIARAVNDSEFVGFAEKFSPTEAITSVESLFTN